MSSYKNKLGVAALIPFALAFTVTDIHAVDLGNGWEPNTLEITRLPNYCQKFFLQKTLPPNCDGVHHLCAGKVLINRLNNVSIPKTERKRILGRAKQEVGYIFTRSNPQCAMMKEARLTESQLRVWEAMLR